MYFGGIGNLKDDRLPMESLTTRDASLVYFGT